MGIDAGLEGGGAVLKSVLYCSEDAVGEAANKNMTKGKRREPGRPNFKDYTECVISAEKF